MALKEIDDLEENLQRIVMIMMISCPVVHRKWLGKENASGI